jgi:hypothetical protein
MGQTRLFLLAGMIPATGTADVMWEQKRNNLQTPKSIDNESNYALVKLLQDLSLLNRIQLIILTVHNSTVSCYGIHYRSWGNRLEQEVVSTA